MGQQNKEGHKKNERMQVRKDEENYYLLKFIV